MKPLIKNVINERRPSGPPAYPLLGHLADFLPDKLGFLQRCVNGYGDVVRLKIGTLTFLLNRPEDIKHVLETNHQNYDKTPRLTSKRGKELSGEGLLTSASGAPHLRQRQLLQPTFHRAVIMSFADAMVSSTEQMLAGWRQGAELDVATEMMSLVQQIMGKILFGLDFLGEARELGEAIRLRRRYMQYMFGSLFPFPEHLPNRINRDYRQAIKRIDEAIYEMIRARRDPSVPHHDMLSMLIRAQYKDGTVMNDKQVRDEALTISITGYETLGEALAWTWYLLSEHPEIESKLWAELQEALGGRPPGVEDLPKLRYTEMVLAESMRLYPPTWIFIRIARQTDVLPSGATIPAGSKLFLCPYVMHRDQRYFPDPDRFDPQRFSDVAQKSRPKFAYFPFGGGRESALVRVSRRWKECLF